MNLLEKVAQLYLVNGKEITINQQNLINSCIIRDSWKMRQDYLIKLFKVKNNLVQQIFGKVIHLFCVHQMLYSQEPKLNIQKYTVKNKQAILYVMMKQQNKYRENKILRFDSISHAHHNKGLALYDLGKNEDAIKIYDEAIRCDPNNTSIFLQQRYCIKLRDEN